MLITVWNCFSYKITNNTWLVNFELYVKLSATRSHLMYASNEYFLVYQLFKGSATKGNFVCLAVILYYFKISFSFPFVFFAKQLANFVFLCLTLDERSLSAPDRNFSCVLKY